MAVVRISGRQALPIVDRCFRPAGQRSRAATEAESHTLQFGHVERGGTIIDEVLVAVMRAPRTFTREDVAELTCHGGLLPAKLVLDALLAAGARLAAPGEFTKRAFLNGRIDLAQAEAVADVIHSRTELALRAAQEQLAGKLSRRIEELRDQLMNLLAHIEAHIDFPEEDIAPHTRDQLLASLDSALGCMELLLRTAPEGRLLRRGFRVAIIGRPNAGKSSLLNQLLGHDRAIVSAIPGTTRDTVEETANIRGLPVVFVDTAGLREARDEIEAEGIRRSRIALERAELVLHVVDTSQPWGEEDTRYYSEGARGKSILVANKADLPRRARLPEPGPPIAVDVSCLTGEGIERLKDEIKEAAWSGRIDAEMLEVMVNSRHQDALERALTAARAARQALALGADLELVGVDLRIAANAAGEIVGKTATEDLLDRIFSQFCIGK